MHRILHFFGMVSLNVTNDIDDSISIECHNYENIELCKRLLHNCNNTPNLKLMSLNIRSYQKNFDDFAIALNRFRTDFCAIILSECWLSEGTIIKPLPGYKPHRTTRQLNKNGGVIIYIKSSYSTVVSEPYITDADSLLIQIDNKIAILGIYRSPSNVIIEPFINSLDIVLKKLNRFPCNFVLGDINLDLCNVSNSQVSEYLCLMATHGLLPAITQPTRLNSCLDHIFIKSSSKAIGAVCKSSITDHDIVIAIEIDKTHIQVPKINNFHSKIDTNAAVTDILTINWTPVLSQAHCDSAVSTFNKIITTILTKHTRMVKVGRKWVSIKPWITPGLIKCMLHRDKLHSDHRNHPRDTQRRLIFTRYRNFCSKLLRNIKAQYNSQQLEINKNDPKKLWRTIKNICYKNQSSTPTELLNNKSFTESLDNCNRHFVSVGENLANEILTKLSIDERSLNSMHKTNLSTSNSLFLYPTNSTEITKIIQNLKNDSAPGPDSINASLIKKSLPSILIPLVHIFNLSLETGNFPECWKVAAISPIHKSGPKNLPNNYRPIALLSIISKILEKIVNHRLVAFLEKHKLISERQYGFRRGRSTNDAATFLTNLVSSHIENGNSCVGVFLDLAKAFDTVSVDLLLRKLHSLGIRGVASQWFTSYLTQRKQFVKIQNLFSESMPINYGVPQGSILGPTLFIIYINEILNTPLTNGEIITYADDTAIIFHDKTWDRVFSRASDGLSAIAKLLDMNLLTLNISKTKYMAFSKTCVSNPPNNLHLNIHFCERNQLIQQATCTCSSISRATSVKYLGVTIDENLSYKQHIHDLSARIRKLIYVVKHLRDCTPLPLLRQIYVALCQPVMQYGISVWGGAGKTNFLTLERAQRALIKVLLRKPFHFPTSLLYNEFNVLSVRQLFVLHATIKTHKNIKSFVDYTNIMSRRVFRIPLPRSTSLLARRAPAYSHLKIYNNICKQLNILNLPMYECKGTVAEWLQKLDYEETEALV